MFYLYKFCINIIWIIIISYDIIRQLNRIKQTYNFYYFSFYIYIIIDSILYLFIVKVHFIFFFKNYFTL